MIEYLWNADDLKKTEHSDSLNIHFSIINSQFQLVLVRVQRRLCRRSGQFDRNGDIDLRGLIRKITSDFSSSDRYYNSWLYPQRPDLVINFKNGSIFWTLFIFINAELGNLGIEGFRN